MGEMAELDAQVQDYKFLGQVKSFDEKKQHGMLACSETQQIWGQDVYIHKNVMEQAAIGLMDYCRFGVHLNTRGQPQASLPVYKVGDDGMPINVKEGDNIIAAEEMAAMDPSFLSLLGDAIAQRSEQQNVNRDKKRKLEEAKGGWGKDGKSGKDGKGWGMGGGDAWGGGGWGGDAWGKGGDAWGKGGDAWGKSGKGGWGAPQSVDLFVGGVPPDASKRELSHIFRQYAGFMSMRLVQKERLLCFVSFATPAQAEFVANALTGYVFDQDSPDQTVLTVQVSKGKGGK